MTSTPLTE